MKKINCDENFSLRLEKKSRSQSLIKKKKHSDVSERKRIIFSFIPQKKKFFKIFFLQDIEYDNKKNEKPDHNNCESYSKIFYIYFHLYII